MTKYVRQGTGDLQVVPGQSTNEINGVREEIAISVQ